jgi:hypothetical protein
MPSIKKITLNKDGTYSGWYDDGNFFTSGPGVTIWTALETWANGLQAPWMTKRAAYEEAAKAMHVRLTFDEVGNPKTVQALAAKD